jgi:GMP synthase (glutamine-hydrolysing)
MRRVVAIRHVPFEDLDGFAAALEARGYRIGYREAPIDDLGAPDLAAADLLVVLGGPIGAYEDGAYPFLKAELALIERRLARERPVLGICLGAQLMARALGARVFPGHAKEIGWGPLELTPAGRESCLGRLAAGTAVLHWHGDTFDLPAGAQHLAATRHYRNQAFACGRHGLALQFHLEATAAGLERWYAAAARHAAPLLPDAQAVLGAWLEGLAPA